MQAGMIDIHSSFYPSIQSNAIGCERVCQKSHIE